MKKRNPAIELFRLLSIFGVCLLHALEQGGYAGPHRGLDNLLMSSVVGFVFISGWFGIRLSARHVVRLMLIAIYCALVPVILYDCIWLHNTSITYLLGCYWLYFADGPWFFWTYLALMLIAPTFEPLFAQCRGGTVVVKTLPVIFMAFGWSYAATKLPVLKHYVPGVGGFGGFGLLTFIGIYLSARTVRVLELDAQLKVWHLVLAFLIAAPFCWIGMGNYHSPFALIVASSTFLLFKRITIKSERLCNVILWFSASTFSIYLLHRQAMGMAVMQYIEDAYIGTGLCNYYLVCIYVAVLFFIGAFALDLPRRAISSLVKLFYQKSI